MIYRIPPLVATDGLQTRSPAAFDIKLSVSNAWYQLITVGIIQIAQKVRVTIITAWGRRREILKGGGCDPLIPHGCTPA